MTVCIAAVCNMGRVPTVIAASDRMITMGDIEFEPNQTKAVYLAQRTVGLLAGDMQTHAAVLPAALENLRRNTTQEDVLVLEIAQSYADEFARYRREKAEREILTPLGLSLERFISVQKDMAPNSVADLTRRLQGYSIGSEAIIAGIDRTGGHIYLVCDPGTSYCFDTSFFCAIGTGEAMAISQFQLAGYDKTWPLANALFLTYSAKVRAEATAGVGKKTDLFIIQPGYPIRRVSEDELVRLREIFDKKQESEKKAEDGAYLELHNYIEELAAKEEALELASKDQKQEILTDQSSVRDQLESDENKRMASMKDS